MKKRTGLSHCRTIWVCAADTPTLNLICPKDPASPARSLGNSDTTFLPWPRASVCPGRTGNWRVPTPRAHLSYSLLQTPMPKSCFPISSAPSRLESSSHWKTERFLSRSFQPLHAHRPISAPLLTPTALLELFASQVVTGSPGPVAARPLLCNIIYASFKCMSLRPSVTSGHLPGSLSAVGTLLSLLLQSPHNLPPDHQALIPTLSRTPKGLWLSPCVPLFTFPKALTSQKHLSGICQ